jgi:hypothetical protein
MELESLASHLQKLTFDIMFLIAFNFKYDDQNGVDPIQAKDGRMTLQSQMISIRCKESDCLGS